MLTDQPPRREPFREQFLTSDKLGALELPSSEGLRVAAAAIESGMRLGNPQILRDACKGFLGAAAEFYRVPVPPFRVLAARPLRVRDSGWTSELFGDYDAATAGIRVWMRTAVRKQVTSYGTFLSTLCHEFCHHLDVARFGFRDTPHTRGFYGRAAALYHHARGTPPKRLFWLPVSSGRWRIDWPRTRGVKI